MDPHVAPPKFARLTSKKITPAKYRVFSTSCTLVFQTPPNNAILQTAIIHRDPDYPWDAHLQS